MIKFRFRNYLMLFLVCSVPFVNYSYGQRPDDSAGYGTPYTANHVECVNATEWTLNASTSTSTTAGQNFGQCVDQGTQYWQRGLGGCCIAYLHSCTVNTYYRDTTRTITQDNPTPEEVTLCNTQLGLDQGEAYGWLGKCTLGEVAACTVGCAAFALLGWIGFAVCEGVCTVVEEAGCIYVFGVLMDRAGEANSYCLYDCFVSGYSYSDPAAGCYN